MTYQALIKRLRDCGAALPDHEAAELVLAIDGKDRQWCLLNPGVPLSSEIGSALKKRESGIPLQYILGEAWFFGNRFIVSPDCLIPQPDTEHLVDKALGCLQKGGRILDLCTGSGCIAISILKETSDSTAAAVDISAPALELAKSNAHLNGVFERIDFIETDVLTDDLSELVSAADVIVSNPPYINTDVIPTLSAEVRHEPRIALDGGEDGMTFYRRFIKVIPQYMKSSAKMFLEIGYDQGEKITELCREAGIPCRLHKDFGGNVRVAEISRVHMGTSE